MDETWKTNVGKYVYKSGKDIEKSGTFLLYPESSSSSSSTFSSMVGVRDSFSGFPHIADGVIRIRIRLISGTEQTTYSHKADNGIVTN